MSDEIFVAVVGGAVGYYWGVGETAEARLASATALAGGSPTYINTISDEFGDDPRNPSAPSTDYVWVADPPAITEKSQEAKNAERVVAIDAELVELAARIDALTAERATLV